MRWERPARTLGRALFNALVVLLGIGVGVILDRILLGWCR
jgi:hypothetical protein